MANKTIAMQKLRSIIRLHTEGKSKLYIAQSLDLSRNTVKKYLRQFTRLKLTWEDIGQLNEEELDGLFHTPSPQVKSDRLKALQAFFPYMSKELRRTGVTRGLLWEEYIKKHPDGYQITQFCEHYNRWNKKVNPVMHIEHKAGDKLYIDFTGKKMQIVDKSSGEIKELEVFVAILGSSNYTYVEAVESQQKEDLIAATENALHFFGGVPQAIVPDNLKSAVTQSNKYEPTLNEAFSDFAEHYDTTVLPARPYRPKDKALVEGAVKIVYTRIYAQLRNQRFFSRAELNRAVLKALSSHNSKKMSGRPYSRKDLFIETEKEVLKPLPVDRFELKEYAYATVLQNGHVCLHKDKHYYSVPYQYIRKKVKLAFTSKRVEIYHKHKRIAMHKRVKSPFNYSTIEDHLASTHRFLTKWNPQYFIDWAERIDEDVKRLIQEILHKKHHPEQAYKSCMGILQLAPKVGKERLIKACSRALDYGIYNYKIVQNILEKGLDQLEEQESLPEQLPSHENIRGNNYYQ